MYRRQVTDIDNIIGEVKAFSFGFVPEGWLPCDGREISQDDYRNLYEVIGNNFNIGNVKPYNFCIPNLQGTVLSGAQVENEIAQVGQSDKMDLSIKPDDVGNLQNSLPFITLTFGICYIGDYPHRS